MRQLALSLAALSLLLLVTAPALAEETVSEDQWAKSHGFRFGVEADVLAGDIDPKKYYPPDVYRVPNKDYPQDFTIDVRQIALMKAKQAQAKLSEKAAKIQAVIDAIERQK